MSATETKGYSLGYSEAEVRRLQGQHQFIGAFTQRCLEDAGIKPGMKVLDVGSGPGDVALMVAQMVGPTGQVVGIEINSGTVETAQARAVAGGFNNLTFITGDVQQIELDSDFDAIVGRLIFFHLKEPVKALQRLLGFLKPGGLVIFQDYDIAACTSCPTTPLFELSLARMLEGFKRGGANPRTGLSLHSIFVQAGLPAPELRCEASISSAHDWMGFDQFAGVIRSLLPIIVKTGLATEEEIEIDTLAERLRVETTNQGGVARGPDVISAWTTKP